MRLAKYRNAMFEIIILIILVMPVYTAAAQDGEEPQVGIFKDHELQPGSRIEVPVEVKGIEELYAIDIEIRFNPEVLQIEDADLTTDGVQPALGMFLDAGLILFNTVDNNAGEIRFVMSQTNPSEPKSGDGVILVLFVQGLSEGESDLEITTLDLSTRSGDLIFAEPVSAHVQVSEEAADKESTSIPIQDPTSVILVNTAAPTQVRPSSTSTMTPLSATDESVETTVIDGIADNTLMTATFTPIGSQENRDENLAGGEEEVHVNEADSKDLDSFFLLKYWWIVVLILILAVGLGLYLWLTRK